MRSWPRRFPAGPDSDAPPPSGDIITLTGALPFYSTSPAGGGTLADNFQLSTVADFISSAGPIVSVAHFVRAEQSPGIIVDYPLAEAAGIEAAPGDVVIPLARVTDSAANVRDFAGSTYAVPLPAPFVIAQPSFSAGVVVGATTFTVNFGSAGPAGTSGMLGDYSPSLVRIFAINGQSKVGELTLLSGNTYTWTGDPLPAGAVVTAQASWTNTTDNVVSQAVTRSASNFGFVEQADATWRLDYTTGTDIGFDFDAPAAYAGLYTLTSVQQGDLPVNKMAPLITGTGAEGQTLTRRAGLWTADGENPDPLTGQWHRNGTPIAGATGGTYVLGGADGGADITYVETVGAKTAISNTIAVATSTKDVDFLFGVQKTTSASSGTLNPFTADFSAVPAGATLIFGVAIQANNTTNGLMTATYGGTDCRVIARSDHTLSQVKLAFFSAVHPGGNPTFATILTGAGSPLAQMVVFQAAGTSAALVTSASFERANAASPGSLSLNVASGNILLAIVGAVGANGATRATTGAGTAAYANTIPTNLLSADAFGLVAGSTETPRAIQTTWSNNAQIAGLAITI